MPPDVRDWVGPDHLVWTVLEVVDQLDTSAFHRLSRRGGAGRAGFDPDVLLGVLILGYCSGQRSSRQLERLCATDVGFRVAAANLVPDHTVLARFRKAHEQAFEKVFSDVLVLAADNGLVRLDTVAVDGTKIVANASLDANRDEQWIRERAAQILAEAEATDAAEDDLYGPDSRGDEPDERMTDPQSRKQAVREWLEELKAAEAAGQQEDQARAAAVAARKQALAAGGRRPGGRHPGTLTDRVELARLVWVARREAQQARREAWLQAEAAGRRVSRRAPLPADEHCRVKAAKVRYEQLQERADAAAQAKPDDRGRGSAKPVRVNTTDPQSRIQKTRRGWVQGYNVQLAVSADQMIVACQVGRGSDMGEFQPMMRAAQHAASQIDGAGGQQRRIGTLLADAGYASDANLTAEGPDRLIALGKGRDLARRELIDPLPPAQGTPRAMMQHRLDTEAGRNLYKRRGATVEPAIGNLKKLLNRFSQRGLAAAIAETNLAAAAFNILKIHRAALA